MVYVFYSTGPGDDLIDYMIIFALGGFTMSFPTIPGDDY